MSTRLPALRLVLAAALVSAGLSAVVTPAQAEPSGDAVPVPAADGAPVPTSEPVSVPAVTPLPITDTSYPWNAADRAADPAGLDRFGYVEEEFLVSGDANVYDWPAGGDIVPFANGPYTTRILVRRPADPTQASGSVVVEMNNPSSQYDVDIMWAGSRDHLMREGDIHVAMTIKPVALEQLQAFDAERYAAVSMANPLPPDETCPSPADFQASDPSLENGLVWDMLSQVGALLKDPSRSVTGGVEVEATYLTGFSQSAAYGITYVNAVAPTVELADGSPAYDGYVLGAGNAFQFFSPINQCATPAPVGSPRSIVSPAGDAPVISIQTESDFASLGAVFTRRADSDAPGDRFRHYEVPGAGHVWAQQTARTPAPDDLERAGFPRNDWDTFCAAPVTDFPLEHVHNAAFTNLDRWVRDGVAPPRATFIETGAVTEVDLETRLELPSDDAGNLLGGVRSTQLDVPTATWFGKTADPTNTTNCALLWGNRVALDTDELARRYRNHGDYVRQVTQRAQELRAERWLTDADAAAVIREAARSDIGKPGAGQPGHGRGHARGNGRG